jgi:outer membrane protein insertion porin family
VNLSLSARKSSSSSSFSRSRPHKLRAKLAACALAGLIGVPWPTVRVLAQPAPATAPAEAPRAGVSPVAPELKGRTIEDVRIAGNATVSTAVIRNLIRTRAGEPFDPATVEEDYQRVYGLKKFANVQARVEPTAAGGVIVVFDVTEQRQVKEIRFIGNASVQTETLLGLIDIKKGESIDPFRISVARQAIQRLYLERNYPQARVTVDENALGKDGVLAFNIVEGPHVRIRKIRILGNHSFTDDKLKDQIKTGSWFLFFNPGRFDPDQLEDDVAAIRQFYQQHGFFDARVGRTITVSPDQTEMMITFVVDEGVRYKIGSVTFKGNTTVPERTLRAGLKLTEGGSYDQDVLRRDVRAMVKDYSKAGGFIYIPQSQDPNYLNIETKTVFHKEAGTVDLIHEIHEGQQFRVGRILVRGNSKVQDKVFLRELRVSPGDRYNSSEFQDAIDRMRGTNLITGAQITPIGDTPGVRDVLIEVKENQTAFFTIGAGFTSNAGVLGNISYEQRNFDISNWPSSWSELFSSRSFTGAGQYFKVQLEPGTQQSRASITFQEPYLFDQPYSFGLNIYYSTRIREHYDEIRAGATTSLGRRFGKEYEWSARANLRGEDVQISSIDNKPLRAPEILAGEGHHTVTSAGFDIRRDTTDNVFLPSRGTVLDFGYERVGALGGPYNFDKLTAEADWYYTLKEDLLDRKTILSLRGRAGYIPGGNAPFFEKFYGGGGGSVRGFQYRGISPRSGPDHDPVGGDFSLTGTAEIGFPLAGEALRGVVFTDVGTVESNLTIGTLRASVGFGFRLNLPIFGNLPLALDFGFPLTTARDDDKQIISFSLGLSQ